MRTCKSCHEEKSIHEFERTSSGHRRRSCGACIYASRKPRRRPQLTPDQREAERARHRELRRRPDQRQRKQEWRARQHERELEQNRQRRAANVEGHREWSRENARLRRLGCSRELLTWSRVLVRDPCAYCGERSTGVDHIRALARGGSNDDGNLVGACFDCNRRKRDQSLLTFLLGVAA